MVFSYESYLSYMEHIDWKGSTYRVMTEDEFEVFKDWLRFVLHDSDLAEPVKRELF